MDATIIVATTTVNQRTFNEYVAIFNMLMILLYAVFATFLCIFAIVSSSINERHIRKIRDTKINSQEYQNTGYRCGKDDLKYVFRTYDREDIPPPEYRKSGGKYKY